MCVCVCVCVCRLVVNIGWLPLLSTIFVFNRVSHSLARLAVHQTTGILFLPPQHKITRHLAFYLGARDLNSGSHASTAEPLPNKPCSRSLWVIFSLCVGPDFLPAAKEVCVERLCHDLVRKFLLPRQRFQHQEGSAYVIPPLPSGIPLDFPP